MSCYNNSLYFYTLLYCRFSTYGLVVSDHLVVILGTRNTRFAGFLGALHALCAISTTEVWASPDLNIWSSLSSSRD